MSLCGYHECMIHTRIRTQPVISYKFSIQKYPCQNNFIRCLFYEIRMPQILTPRDFSNTKIFQTIVLVDHEPREA